MKQILSGLLACSLLAFSQTDKRFAPAFGGRRLALVIGNKSYAWKPLVNPANDATAVARTLATLGFAPADIHLVIDAGEKDLRRNVREFVESVKPGDLALVYYSGHGVEVHGVNYLLPIDMKSDVTEGYVEDEAVSAQRLLQELDGHGARAKVLILDACRDNPLRAAKSTAGGLAPMEGKGSLIVFATEAGRTAGDTPGSSNSIFTRYLLDGLRLPGVPLDDAMKRVAKNVAQATGEKQVPAIYGLMLEDVILVQGSSGSVTAIPPSLTQSSSVPADEDAWLTVKDSGDARLLEQFIREYPQSHYAGAARLKLASLHSPPPSESPSTQLSPPSVMHICFNGCNAGRGLTLIWRDGRYVAASDPNGAGMVITVERFTSESVIMHRTDFGQYPGKADLTGQLASDGKSVVNGIIAWTFHPCCPLATAQFRAAWGSAMESVPGK